MCYLLSKKEKEIVTTGDFVMFTAHKNNPRKNMQLHNRKDVCSNDLKVYKSTSHFSLQFR